MKIGIIDYGYGNLGSVIRALNSLNVEPFLIKNNIDIKNVNKLILPGVGSFSDCAKTLEKLGWYEILHEEVLNKGKPLLGICVGMQLLSTIGMEGSQNGTRGLNFVPGKVENLKLVGCSLRLPHVGWNEVNISKSASELEFWKIPNKSDFYFVHSFTFLPENPQYVVAYTEYGVPFAAAIRKGHIWGTQFHPEKSSKAGLRFLQNFIEKSKC